MADHNLCHVLLISSLRNGFAGTVGRQLAESIAQRWLTTMFAAWSSEGRLHHRMLEKYDANEIGGGGGGGEYEVQSGFG